MAQFPGSELVLHPVFRSELLKEVCVERDEELSYTSVHVSSIHHMACITPIYGIYCITYTICEGPKLDV